MMILRVKKQSLGNSIYPIYVTLQLVNEVVLFRCHMISEKVVRNTTPLQLFPGVSQWEQGRVRVG
jgi:hypothetical protein